MDILWVRERAVADDRTQLSFLIMRIAGEHGWTEDKSKTLVDQVMSGAYTVLPNVDRGGFDIVFRRSERSTPGPGHCPECGSDLTLFDFTVSGSTVICPFCGTDYTRQVAFADLRSTETRDLETSAFKPLDDPEEEALSQQLISLLREYLRLDRARRKEDRDRVFAEIREVGVYLGCEGNDSRMQRVGYRVLALGGSTRILEYAWSGICGWQV